MTELCKPMTQRLRNELAAYLLLNEERKPLLEDKKTLKETIYEEIDSDLSVSDVSWSDNNRHIFLSRASTTNHTIQLKSKFRARAQKKYEKMVDKRKLQSENISKMFYTGKNHVTFFVQLEFSMKHHKDLRFFKIYNAKSKKRVSLLKEAHTLSEEDVKNHLDNMHKKKDIRITRVYRNYFRGLYLSLQPETVQHSVTQIITCFKNNAIKLIWWLYNNYRAVTERRIEDIKREISSIDISKTSGRNIATFNHTARRLWQLSNQYSNPIDDLFTKVKDA